MEALILKIMKRLDENEHAECIRGVPWNIGTLVKDGLNRVQEYINKYKGSFTSCVLGSDDPEQAKEYMEEEYWEELARMVFREPYQAYETQLSYLMHDIQKPYNVSFTDYKARVEQVFGYLTSFPAPSLRNKDPIPDDIDKRNTPIKPNIIREALYNSLPKTWRDEFERRETVDVREVSEPIFIDIMLKIEEEDNAFQAKYAESRNNNNNQSVYIYIYKYNIYDEQKTPSQCDGEPGQHFHMDFGFVSSNKYQIRTTDGRNVTSIDGKRAYLLVVDRASRYMWTYITDTKEPPIEAARMILSKFKLDHPHRTV